MDLHGHIPKVSTAFNPGNDETALPNAAPHRPDRSPERGILPRVMADTARLSVW